jgi:hypothetical protein
MLKNSAETANAARSLVPPACSDAPEDATLASLGNTCGARADFRATTFLFGIGNFT